MIKPLLLVAIVFVIVFGGIRLTYVNSPAYTLDKRLENADYNFYKSNQHFDIDRALEITSGPVSTSQDILNLESDIQSERIERVLRDLKSYDIGVEFWYYYAEKCNHNIKDMLTMAVKENRLDPLDADNVLLICNKNGIVWRPDFKEFQSNHEYMVARGTYEANAESARKNWHVENYKP